MLCCCAMLLLCTAGMLPLLWRWKLPTPLPPPPPSSSPCCSFKVIAHVYYVSTLKMKWLYNYCKRIPVVASLLEALYVTAKFETETYSSYHHLELLFCMNIAIALKILRRGLKTIIERSTYFLWYICLFEYLFSFSCFWIVPMLSLNYHFSNIHPKNTKFSQTHHPYRCQVSSSYKAHVTILCPAPALRF